MHVMIWLISVIAILAAIGWYRTDREMIRQLGVILQLRADVDAANRVERSARDRAEYWEGVVKQMRLENLGLEKRYTAMLAEMGKLASLLPPRPLVFPDDGIHPKSIGEADAEAADAERTRRMREMVPVRVRESDVAPPADAIEHPIEDESEDRSEYRDD